MTTMIERVAREIAENGWGAREWDDWSDDRRLVFLNTARAAIEAMREPTDAMGLRLPSDYRPGSHSATQIWQAMIDAALDE